MVVKNSVFPNLMYKRLDLGLANALLSYMHSLGGSTDLWVSNSGITRGVSSRGARYTDCAHFRREFYHHSSFYLNRTTCSDFKVRFWGVRLWLFYIYLYKTTQPVRFWSLLE